jgi:hypothetical protein
MQGFERWLGFLSVLSALELVLECFLSKNGIRALFSGYCKFWMIFGIEKAVLCTRALV